MRKAFCKGMYLLLNIAVIVNTLGAVPSVATAGAVVAEEQAAADGAGLSWDSEDSSTGDDAGAEGATSTDDTSTDDTSADDTSADEGTNDADADAAADGYAGTEAEGDPAETDESGLPAEALTSDGAEAEANPPLDDPVAEQSGASLAPSETPAKAEPILSSLAFFYLHSDDPDATPPVWQELRYDPLSNPPGLPRIEKRLGELQLLAYLSYLADDGSGTIQESLLKPEDSVLPCELEWSIKENRDIQGDLISDPNLALASVNAQTGKLTATGKGNGTITLLCSFKGSTLPDGAAALGEQSIKVEISDNQTTDTALYAVGFDLCYRPLDSNLQPRRYVKGGEIPTISKLRGGFYLSVELVLNDGSRISANAAGVDASWELIQGSGIASYDANNKTVTALGVENGSAIIRCKLPSAPPSSNPGLFSGISVTQQDMLISITGNSPSDDYPRKLSMLYSDAYDTNKVYAPQFDGRYPTVIALMASVQLTPVLDYSSSGATNPLTSGGHVPRWKILRSTNLLGEPSSTTLALLSNDGVVAATGLGDGILSIQFSLDDLPGIAAVVVDVYIQGNAGDYITSLTIVDANGRAFDNNTMFVETTGELIELFATAKYNNSSTKDTWRRDTIDNLVWTVNDTEQAAIEPKTGMLVLKEQFQQIEVTATATRGGFALSDVVAKLYISSGQEGGDSDYHSDTLELRVFFESDYYANRSDATPVATQTLDLSYITNSLSTRFTQYTWSRFDDIKQESSRWGTMGAYGVSLDAVMADIGVHTTDMVAMNFRAKNYGNSSYFTSGQLYAPRYYYPNFPHSAGRVSVEPMLAISTERRDRATSVSGANMVSNARFRFCRGLLSTTDSNDSTSIKWIYGVDIIVLDESIVLNPHEEDEVIEYRPGPGGEDMGLGGNGGSGGSGGGTGGAPGTATSGFGGGSGGDGSDDSESSGSASGGGGATANSVYSIHQILSESQTHFTVPDEDNPFIPAGTAAAIGALLLGAGKATVAFSGQTSRKSGARGGGSNGGQAGRSRKE